MKKATQFACFAVPALLAVACGSSSSSPSPAPSVSSTPSGTSESSFNGTFVPLAGAAQAQFATITFHDATTYSLTRANCSGTCSSSGTYTFDGVEDLELTDSTTKTTEHVDFKATKEFGATTTARSLHVLGGSLLGGDAGGSLVTDGGPLVLSIAQILQASVNGILMGLEGSDGGTTSGGDDDDDSSDAGSSGVLDPPPKSDAYVADAILELQHQLASAPLQTYYQDGTRVQGCFANPVGKDLTPIQKTFYCSMPLEFRLCNSIVLLFTKNNPDVSTRWNGFLKCQQTVEQATGNTGSYLYDETVNGAYYWLMLNNDSELSAEGEANLVAEWPPKPTTASFPSLVTTIAGSVLTEAKTPAFNGLSTLLSDAQSAASSVGASIP